MAERQIPGGAYLVESGAWQYQTPGGAYWAQKASTPGTPAGRYVKRLVTRTAQPQDGASIDWNNPITRGLVHAFTGREGYDYAQQKSAPVLMTGAVTGNVSPLGAGLSLANNSILDFNASEDWSGARTLFSLMRVNSVATWGAVFKKEGAGGAGQFELFRNASVQSLVFRVDNATNINNTNINISPDLIGKYAAVAISMADVGSVRSYLNGELKASFSVAGPQVSGVGTYKYGGTGGFGSAVDVFATLIFNRALSDSEIKSLSSNPWQIFEPEVQMVWEFEAEVSLLPAPQGRYEERLVTRTSQPQEPTRVDWNNPITKSLRIIVDQYGKPFAPLPIFQVGTASARADTKGVLLKNNTGSGSIYRFRPTAEAYTGMTFFAVISRNATGYSDTAGANILQVASEQYGGYGSGLQLPGYNNGLHLKFIVRQANYNGDISIGHTIANTGDSKFQVICGTFMRGQGAKLFINGELVGSAAGSGEGFEHGFYDLIATAGGALPSNKGGTYFSIFFSRCLTVEEVLSLSANPWQLFEPDLERVWVEDAPLIALPPPVPMYPDADRLAVRTSQPQSGVEIDWNNPLTKGLVWASIPGMYGMGNIVTKAVPSESSFPAGARLGSGQRGLALDNSAAGGMINFSYLWSKEATRMAKVFSGPFTQIGIASYSSTGANTAGAYASRIDNSFTALALSQNSTSSNLLATTMETLTVIPSGITFTDLRNSHSWAVATDAPATGANVEIDVGSLTSSGVWSGTPTAYPAIPVHYRKYFFSEKSNNGSPNTTLWGKYYCHLIWERKLSRAERKAVAENPWQLFEQETLHTWAPAFAASVTLPTLVQPVSTIAAGAWVATGAPSLHEAINEPVRNDSTFISTNEATSGTWELAESAFPGGALQSFPIVASSPYGTTLTVTLFQGATTIMTRAIVLTAVDTLYTLDLTAPEIATIVAGPISVTLTTS